MMSGVDTIAIIIGQTKKRLKEAWASSEETAKTPKGLGLDERWLKTSRSGGAVATKDGRYYQRAQKR